MRKDVPARPTPLRSCIGCRAVRAQRELLRLVSTGADTAALDLRQRLPGRGAYICPAAACLRRAMKGKGLERALRHPVSPDSRSALEAAVAEHLKSMGAPKGGARVVKET